MMLKLTRLVSVPVIVLALACGAVTIRLDTEVSDETEIKHDIQMEMSGPIAAMASEEFNEDDLDEKCTASIDEAEETFELSCKGLSQSEMRDDDLFPSSESQENELESQEFDFDVEVTKVDLGDQWEYEARMRNSFSISEEELETDLFTGVMDLDAIIKFRFHWTVDMPGEIVEANADTYEKGTASFIAKLDDDRETFAVVSRQDKGGSCN